MNAEPPRFDRAALQSLLSEAGEASSWRHR
jgi:hypothetical protein